MIAVTHLSTLTDFKFGEIVGHVKKNSLISLVLHDDPVAVTMTVW